MEEVLAIPSPHADEAPPRKKQKVQLPDPQARPGPGGHGTRREALRTHHQQQAPHKPSKLGLPSAEGDRAGSRGPRGQSTAAAEQAAGKGTHEVGSGSGKKHAAAQAPRQPGAKPASRIQRLMAQAAQRKAEAQAAREAVSPSVCLLPHAIALIM